MRIMNLRKCATREDFYRPPMHASLHAGTHASRDAPDASFGRLRQRMGRALLLLQAALVAGVITAPVHARGGGGLQALQPHVWPNKRTCCQCAGAPWPGISGSISHWCPRSSGFKGCHPPPQPGQPLSGPAYRCNYTTARPISATNPKPATEQAQCPTPCLAPTLPPLPRPSTPPLPRPSVHAKRGVCMAPGVNSTHCDDLRALSSAVTWYTNWEIHDQVWQAGGRCAEAPDEPPAVPTVEFVPQIWSPRHLQGALPRFPPGTKYLLAFNEPDKHGATSWVDPAAAAAVWSNLTTLANRSELQLVGASLCRFCTISADARALPS